MKTTPITWADAEMLFPHCEFEWRSMLGYGSDFTPSANTEVRLELVEWDDGTKFLRVVQLDPEGKWLSPPEWRCWEGGTWTHPIPTPKVLLFDLRHATKPIKFHDQHCPFPKTATCLCGREPFYSPEARKQRGELGDK